MKLEKFAWAGADESVQQLVGQIPWGHHLVLVVKLGNLEQREFYLRQAITHGWSRAVLTAQIKSGLHTRQGKAISNFSKTLQVPQSDLAQEIKSATQNPKPIVLATYRLPQEERQLF